MNEIYLVIDESGAKGYSNKPESSESELGVMAGYFINPSDVARFSNDIDKIKSNFSVKGKFHMASIESSEEKEKLRDEIFQYLLNNNIPCIYSESDFAGFNQFFLITNDYLRKEHLMWGKSKIKTSAYRKIKESFHTYLFQLLFGDAIVFCLTYGLTPIKIKIITDNIDKKIKKSFEDVANKLLAVELPEEKKYTAFNTENKKKLLGKINFNNDEPITGINYSLDIEDSSLTLVADVLANSLHHHFKQGKKIINHPLEKSCFTITMIAQWMKFLSIKKCYKYDNENSVLINNSQMFASEYKAYLLTETELRTKLENDRARLENQIIREPHDTK